MHWLTIEVGKKIGSDLGHMEKLMVPSRGNKTGRHLKIKGKMDISKPLPRGTITKMKGNYK